MGGRKRIPQEIKEARGTARNDRVLENRIQYSEMIPHNKVDGFFINEIAIEQWNLLTNEMSKIGFLQNVDITMLAAYCNAAGVYFEAIDMLKKYGYLSKNEARRGPWMIIANDALDKMIKLSSHFGFTPASREKISWSPPEQKQEDEGPGVRG